MKDALIQTVLKGAQAEAVPFWFMRQAGRYLPEYRELRAQAGGFLKLCYTPELAAEVTLQPLRRFGMSAAILFSDILIVPHAMGMDVRFEEGEGPVMTPVRGQAAIAALKPEVKAHVAPIMETIRRVRSGLAPDKALIGFAGAPWTVACYMVEGHGKSSFEKVRAFALAERKLFSALIDTVVTASVEYLSLQVEAGADVIQLFDSWAGILSEAEFADWVIAPTKAIVARLKTLHPHIPVIGFPRGAGAKLAEYARQTGVGAVSIDAQTPMGWAAETITLPLQGNLDPLLLAHDRAGAVEETRRLLQRMNGRPFIFNLGHGIVPATPLENVQAVCDTIREFSARRKAG